MCTSFLCSGIWTALGLLRSWLWCYTHCKFICLYILLFPHMFPCSLLPHSTLSFFLPPLYNDSWTFREYVVVYVFHLGTDILQSFICCTLGYYWSLYKSSFTTNRSFSDWVWHLWVSLLIIRRWLDSLIVFLPGPVAYLVTHQVCISLCVVDLKSNHKVVGCSQDIFATIPPVGRYCQVNYYFIYRVLIQVKLLITLF